MLRKQLCESNNLVIVFVFGLMAGRYTPSRYNQGGRITFWNILIGGKNESKNR
jgi:hypothetical protein